MRNAILTFLWLEAVGIIFAQETFVKVYDFPIVPVIGYNVKEYDGRIYTIASLFSDLGGYFVECGFLAELNATGDTLWTTLIPDIDVASGSLVIVNDTITITGNNDPFNTAFRMVHFTLEGEKNPAKGEINLSFKLQYDANVSIFRSDLLGKSSKLHEGFYISGSHTFIDHESISLNGIYLYSIKIGNDIKTTQAIIAT